MNDPDLIKANDLLIIQVGRLRAQVTERTLEREEALAKIAAMDALARDVADDQPLIDRLRAVLAEGALRPWTVRTGSTALTPWAAVEAHGVRMGWTVHTEDAALAAEAVNALSGILDAYEAAKRRIVALERQLQLLPDETLALTEREVR